MAGLTPVQQKVIETWTEKRDTLLREISIHTTELEEKKKLGAQAGDSLYDLEKRIAEATGRLSVLESLEERYRNSLSTDIAEMEARKSKLDSDCKEKEEKLASMGREYDILVSAIGALTSSHDTIQEYTANAKSLVDEIIVAGKVAASDTKSIMDEVRTVATEVITKSNSNVEQMNIILGKFPRFIFDLQKPIPVRRTYPNGHPNAFKGTESE